MVYMLLVQLQMMVMLLTEAKLAFGLSQGKAYVKGYEIGKIGTTYIDVNKARDFETASGSTTRFNIGSFVNVRECFWNTRY